MDEILSDDGRQSILDELCADYRDAHRMQNHDEIMNTLNALKREIRDFDGNEWSLGELNEVMRPLVSGQDWKTRTENRKIPWYSLVKSLQEIRRRSNPS